MGSTGSVNGEAYEPEPVQGSRPHNSDDFDLDPDGDVNLGDVDKSQVAFTG